MSFSNILFDFASATTDTRSYGLLPETHHTRSFMNNEIGRQLAEYLKLDIDNGPWLAGGAVRKAYLNIDMGESDWDIWFSAPEQFTDAETKLKSIGAYEVYKSDNAISFKYEDKSKNTHNIQIIRKRFYDNAEQIINGFDFTVCQLVTDGNRTIMGPHTASDLKTRTLRLAQLEVPQYIIPRMVKYIVYGYNPCQQLLDQIDQSIDNIDWNKNANDYEAV